MAKKRLTLRDKQGKVIDYDISAARVTIDAEGKTLEVKLSELVNAIADAVKSISFNGNTQQEDAAGNVAIEQVQADWNQVVQSHPSFIKGKPNVVTGIKVGESGTTITPANGVVTIPESSGGSVDVDNAMSASSDNPVANRVIKAYVDNLINGLINGAPAALDTLNELSAALGNDSNFAATITQQLALKANDANVVKSISVNGGTAQTPSNGNVNLVIETGGLTENDIDVSVPNPSDGTFTINVGNDTYTINLNHTHDGMTKLVKCTEQTLPQTLDDDTIYVQVDDATSPTEIEKLYFFGIPFEGGGGQETLPYDAAISFLQSSGTQYINTGVEAGSNFQCEIKAEFVGTPTAYDTVLGTSTTTNGSFGIGLGCIDTSNVYAQFGTVFVQKNATLGTPHVYKSNIQNNVITIEVDGDSASDAFSGGSIPSNNTYLFGRNKGGTLSNASSVKIYYCKIWKNGDLVRNFIPVRDGQNGCMYDKVSKTLFTNSGTGTFTLGSDLTE